MLKAAIYDPYLDTLGGGERYCLTVAEILLQQGYTVDLFWSGDPQLISKASDRFSLNLSGLNLVPDIFQITPSNIFNQEGDIPQSTSLTFPIAGKSILSKSGQIINKYRLTSTYDLIFFLSDGSLPFLFSKKNILHVQVPLVHLNYSSPLNRLKLKTIDHIVCNSHFTQKLYENTINHPCDLIYPPVDVEKFHSGPKENIILTVGRFDNLLNAKKQDILIDAFKTIIDSRQLSDWKFILAGASQHDPDNNHYLQLLIKSAQGYPIEFVVNQNFSVLQDLYAKSKIYWHAAGFGVDENQLPQNTEHFGITVVEAMASGLVPIVIAKGGLPEIVSEGQNGFLWNDIDNLINRTKFLCSDPHLLQQLSAAAQDSSRRYSKEVFRHNFLSLIN